MSNVNCKHCQAEVLSEAMVCPHCGESNFLPDGDSADRSPPRILERASDAPSNTIRFLVGCVTLLFVYLVVGAGASGSIALLLGEQDDLWKHVVGGSLLFLAVGCLVSIPLACIVVSLLGRGTRRLRNVSFRHVLTKMATGGILVGLACTALGAVLALAVPVESPVFRVFFPFMGALLGTPVGLILQYGSAIGSRHQNREQRRGPGGLEETTERT